MTSQQFEKLYQGIGEHMWSKTNRNHAFTASQKMKNALHYLGTDAQCHAVGDMHGASKSTIERHLHEFCDVTVNHLLQEVIKWPENPQSVARAFYKYAKLPYVAGAVDGTLVKILGPIKNEEQFVDRKGNHSLNAMMVCGADMKFYYVNANYPGSVHDARVMRNSNIFRKFESGWRPFPGAVLLGDSAYPLKDWLIPYNLTNPNDPIQCQLYEAHKLARHLIECAYGILKRKFPCLNFLRFCPKKSANIIITCAILHNFCREQEEEEAQDDGYPEDVLNNLPDGTGLQRLMSYFETA